MRVKDMFLKNRYYLFSLFVFITLFFFHNAQSATEQRDVVLSYLNSLKFFSASCVQNDGNNLSEGKVFVGEKRVRAEYFSPTKILIILDENKAMYYNYELEEDEFFNPKNTNASFFYDVFRNPFFFKDSTMETKNNEIILEKVGVENNETTYKIKVYFENKPLLLRGIEVFINEDYLKLSIFNHKYNEEFDKKFFKLINPKLIN